MSLKTADGVVLESTLDLPDEAHGAVLLAHGITADQNENGLFVTLARRLREAGFAVLRFSYRGHGGSGGTQRGVTIAGERLDFRAAAALLRSTTGGPLSVVASSFGTVSTLLSLPLLPEPPVTLVLWNPVLDLERTFLRPELPRGLDLYGPAARESLEHRGFVDIDGRFQLDAQLFDEFGRYDVRAAFEAVECPVLVVHGDQDRHVPYHIAQQAVLGNSRARLHTVQGADHGFGALAGEALDVTVDWLLRRQQVRPAGKQT